ncbi:DoxX family protein [Rhizobium sullae]|uniref:DoxX family protein n=1 Tax=Rhizobium sullae TaxID=50338 RepID=A0A2N0DEH6_RHISU|nr:DoxX family protein [Rhizobium sullae]PKA44507.1 DoxX family protein [Rhizobium sullae]
MLFSATQLQPYLLSLLRIVSALVLFSYGTQKIIGFPASDGGPPPGSLPWVAGLFELILGFSLLIGFRSRSSAFILSGVMAFAYFLRHAPQSFYPAQNGGAAAIIFCFVLLYLAAAGGGPLSLDRIIDTARVKRL